MSTGQAPSLMLDLATSRIRDRQRFARERAQTGAVRRARTARAKALKSAA